MITFDNSFFPIWLPLSIFVLFMLVWFTTLLLTSVIGGWLRLADKFPRRQKPGGKAIKYVSGSLNYGSRVHRLLRANYGRLLTLWVDQNGLTLAVLPIFRPAHPPIQLPWSVVTQTDSSNSNSVILQVASPATTIVLRGKGADAVRSALATA